MELSEHPHFNQLIANIKLEGEAQEEKYSPLGGTNFKQLKAEGVLLHPLKITRKSYGYAEYPEIAFQVLYPVESSVFKNGSSIQLFLENEAPINGMLLYLEGNKGELRLFAPDFPDWIEERGIGVQLVPDQRTIEQMLKAMKSIPENSRLSRLFLVAHTPIPSASPTVVSTKITQFQSNTLNNSQKSAVEQSYAATDFHIIHGPPGTGKTTTLVELVYQLHKSKERIVISAPSNAAIDHLGLQLAKIKLPFIRIGNTTKINEALLPYTIEGKMEKANLKTTIKNLRIQSEQLRKMAHQYKRNFGKSERDQRKLLLQEVKSIRKEIRSLQEAFEEKEFAQTKIILGTPVGIQDAHFEDDSFDTLIFDEAGQCLEPLSWMLFGKAKKLILAGDPYQLPPTVISYAAESKGFSKSLLEHLIANNHTTSFLDTQYRMQSNIAEYSNEFFYKGELKTGTSEIENHVSIHFYDSAGADFSENLNSESFSIMNEAELNLVSKIVDKHAIDSTKTAFISPYSGQVHLAKQELVDFKRISTIDSFQGQEEETIIISLVRSNAEQIIGFLKDYRRMNVALTRAKKQLFIIGDSATLGGDSFYSGLIDFIEKKGGYHSVWELEI